MSTHHILITIVIAAVVSGLSISLTWNYAQRNADHIFESFASGYLTERMQMTTPATSSAPRAWDREADPSRIDRTTLVTQESLVVDAVARANPAVISIIITKDVPIIEQYYEEYNPFGNDPFFQGIPWGFSVPRYRERGTEEREVGGGSGFIVRADGLAVTNRHVVADTDASYTAFTNTGDRYEVEVIARDPFFDIAVIQLADASDLPYLTLADSGDLRLGQTAIAIGNALTEFQNSVSVGVISGLGRSVVATDRFGQRPEQLDEVIQTDAAINPGNSGGPLLDLDGRVIGMNVAVALGSENIGFALPSDLIANVIASIDEHGEIVRPYLGVRYRMVTPSLVEANKLPVDHGALVFRGENVDELAVVPGSPADKAGIEENDIILEIDGRKIDAQNDLASVIRRKQVGDTVELLVLHEGDEVSRQLTLEAMPE